MFEIESGIAKAPVERRRFVAKFQVATAAEILASVFGSNPSALPISRAAMRLR